MSDGVDNSLFWLEMSRTKHEGSKVRRRAMKGRENLKASSSNCIIYGGQLYFAITTAS